jgi:DNA modification methylase
MKSAWPADKVERRQTDSLAAYARNARTHSDAQVLQIARSIEEFGWTVPILVDEAGQIIAGHGRVLAAKKLGLAEVPVMVADGWTEAQKRAYVIADNKLTLNGGWDDALLRDELDALRGLDFDLGLTGFGDDELAAIFADRTDGLTDPDDTPEAPAEPVTELGDVWLLGRHRIVCGDSTDADVVAKALNGVAPHLMVTDPPYGVAYEAGWRNEAMPHKNDPSRWKDGAGSPTGAVLNDTRADWREAWALFPGDVAYVWHAGNMAHVVAESLIASGFPLRSQIIWAKSQFVIGRGDYHPHHEPCWYAVRKGKVGHYVGGRKQSTLWQIDKPQKSETGHSTQKPVECMKRPIENNSSPGQAVYEPFSGSGTTIIAGEMTGRAIHAIELNPAYIDVAVTRWQNFTGQTATLEATGQSFVEVMAHRRPGPSITASFGSDTSRTGGDKSSKREAGSSRRTSAKRTDATAS